MQAYKPGSVPHSDKSERVPIIYLALQSPEGSSSLPNHASVNY